MNLQNIALEQTTVVLGEREYLVTALPAIDALELQDQLSQNEFKLNPKEIKKLICKCVAFENKQITDKSFDILFSRKTAHLQELVGEILKWGFEDLFTESGTED